MVGELILLVLGLFLLVKGADYIVEGASSLAKKFGVSTLVIGLTIVAFGTSLPELIVNIFATIEGSGGVAFGNIIGSNIANVLLVLGVTAIIHNVNVKEITVWREIPFALLAAFLLFVFSNDTFFGDRNPVLGPREGIVFLCLFGIFLYFMFQSVKYDQKKRNFTGKIEEVHWPTTIKLVLGMAAIYFGGRFVVDGAIFIATNMGISEFLISATVIALGTSLPELVVSVMAAMRGKIGLAVGNVVGSNIFNILWVLGIVPIINPIKVPHGIGFDMAIMFLSTLVLFIFMFVGKRHEIRRKDGILFIIAYVFYIYFIIVRG